MSADLAARTRRRTMWRLLPFLILLYVVAYLDRVNVSFAALEMRADLGFSAEVYGFGAGIFFIGYVLLEIPGTLLVERWSARLWISRIMISWGLLAALTGFVQTANQFYWIRFLLGVGEAGFFPGVIVYLTHWFRESDRGKAVSIFAAAVPISSIIGAPISGLLLGVHWMGLPGWRWIFIIEGIPAVILGVVVLLYLTDRPHQASWLEPEEREWLAAELEREKLAKQAVPHSIADALRQLRRPQVIILSLVWFGAMTGGYGFGLWLPTMVKALSGLPNLAVTAIAALPYIAGLISMLFMGWSSDRTGERRWHTAVSLFVAALGLVLSVLLREHVALSIAAFCLVGVGLYGTYPGFWSLPSTLLTGSAAAAAIGMINCLGNIGGFAGPYIVGRIDTATGSFVGGMLYLAASMFAGGLLVLLVGREKPSEVAAKTTGRMAAPPPVVRPMPRG
jgi:ACS family tartrate transporter-like MFS transporter